MAETYSIVAVGLSFVAATAKTGIELATPSTQTARLITVSCWFDGSGSGNNAKVELVRFTTTGTGTTYTPLKANGEAQNKAAICTAKTNDTVEPGTPTVLKSWYVPNNAGLLIQWPLGRELYVPVSSFLGIRVTSAVGVTGSMDMEFEE